MISTSLDISPKAGIVQTQQGWIPLRWNEWTHLGALVVEALEEALQQFIGVIDPLGVLANNPDHGGSSVRLIQRVQVLTQRCNDALIPEVKQSLNGQNYLERCTVICFCNVLLKTLMIRNINQTALNDWLVHLVNDWKRESNKNWLF